MGNAVRQIQGAQQRTIGVVNHDRLLADCNFDVVQNYTNIENPYLKVLLQFHFLKIIFSL